MRSLFVISIAVFLAFGWFLFAQEADPVIDNIFPGSAAPNASVTVTGRNFAETSGGNLVIFYQGTAVMWSTNMSITRASTSNNPTQEFSLRVPNIASGAYTIKVSSTIGSQVRESNSVNFTVSAAQSQPPSSGQQHPPSLRISPTSASVVSPQSSPQIFGAWYKYWFVDKYVEQDASGGAVWTSSDQSVAQVVQGGAVCGKNGTATIKASYLGLTANATLRCSGFTAAAPAPAPEQPDAPPPPPAPSNPNTPPGSAPESGGSQVDPPSLVGPADGSQYNNNVSITFQWSPVSGATSPKYGLLIRDSFDNTMFVKDDIGSAQFAIPKDTFSGQQNDGEFYYWTVRLFDSSRGMYSDYNPVQRNIFVKKVSAPAPGSGSGSGSGGVLGITFPNPLGVDTFEELLSVIINFIFSIGIVLAPLIFIIAGFFYVTSAGDQQRLETAKNLIKYTIIGLVVLLLAKGAVAVIKSVLGVQ